MELNHVIAYSSMALILVLSLQPVSRCPLSDQMEQRLKFISDWGDTISVTVENEASVNGTDIHWHGIRQLNSNSQDGVGGVTECK